MVTPLVIVTVFTQGLRVRHLIILLTYTLMSNNQDSLEPSHRCGNFALRTGLSHIVVENGQNTVDIKKRHHGD